MRSFWGGFLGAVMLLASLQPLQSLPALNGSSLQLLALTETEMMEVLDKYNNDAISYCNAQSLANWDVQTHVGDQTYTQIQVEKSLEYANFRKEHYDLYFKDAIIDDYTDEGVRRQLKFLKDLGSSAMSDDDLKQFTDTRNAMTAIYNSAKICPYTQRDCESDPNFTDYLTLDPEIEVRMAESRDYDELQYLWTEWREKSGKLMREDYKEYVRLINLMAQLNGYTEAGEMWRGRYEVDNFEQMAEDLWVQVEPLYNELHTYVKLKLEQIYKDKLDPRDETIPAHILGNMWAQSWSNLYEDLKPFKNATLVDVTGKMLEQGYTIMRMFEDSDEYYESLGLGRQEMSYNPPSIIEKPEDRIIACHASAWDFCNGQDFRIKMCTKINMKDYNTVHHEMGHINYYLHYRDLPLLLRGGANPGFHEAVGDAISLAVETPQHLQRINLLDEYADSEEDNINALFSMALERVAFLPFGYLIDKWRWDVFRNAIPESQWNSHWWALRRRYQKISPPVERSEEYFDPGAKYHIPADSQYMSYFTARILQFQFYKAMCIAAGQYDENNPQAQPLHKCNFYQSVAAGDRLKAGLQLGTSKHWSDALEAITGSRVMDASPLIEYFQPLYDFLKVENENLRNEAMQETLREYNVLAAEEAAKMVHASWDVSTNIGNTAIQEQYNQAVLQNAQFHKEKYEEIFSGLNPEDYTDEDVRRQLLYLTKLGISILPEEDLSTLTAAKLRMENTYSDAKICPYTKRDCNVDTDPDALTLDPEITKVMAESTDYDELEYVWKEWREKSGKLMRSDYRTYIDLSNRAATMNGFADYGDMWRFEYEDPNFAQNMENLWNQVEPLYSTLHTYVRHKLIDVYGSDKVKVDEELIPAHLLGNMWAQSWVNLYDRIKPFDASVVDVTQSLVDGGYTAFRMFEVSNEFFMSLGLPSNEMSYTGQSIIEKPTDRVITCHASAWDFMDGEDFRVKMCTTINMEDFITVHHEMGHIAYFILYKDQPVIFRGGANPGFHEAVGDLIALSVSTPTHLQKIGLLQNYADTREDNINALFQMALERVAFLPFGLLIDMWRWDVFSGAIPESNWNAEWWNMRKRYQKVEPSNGETRGEEFFDAGAKFHVPADCKYMSYFVAHILEFQLHKAMCITAGQYDPINPTANPLHKCDIHNSLEVGEKLRAGLGLGLSKHWSEALREMTGETELSAAALLEYFSPLVEYLQEENEKWELKEEETSNRIPVIVGSVIGSLLAVCLIGYGIYLFRKRRIAKKQVGEITPDEKN
uniref:Angiotensin-converting enzyme n=1 Tax=Lutzomyia longipalpis TaxID=7200 RepID=A0A7G3ADB7_LUTLO